jgi:hypothetical protein
LVISDVPAGSTAIGVPAKLLPVIFRCSSSPACAPSAEPEERTSGISAAEPSPNPQHGPCC